MENKKTTGYIYIVTPVIIILLIFTIITALLPCRSRKIKAGTSGISSYETGNRPSRIITIGPGTTEIACSLMKENRIIAVSSASDYPPSIRKKIKVGDFFLDYEKIISLKPDLVIVESTLNPNSPEILKELGIPTLLLNTVNYGDLLKTISEIGDRTGNRIESDRLKARIQGEMAGIFRKTNRIPREKRPRVFIEVWPAPLMTAGSDTLIGQIIEMAGGINIAEDLTGYPMFSLETLIMKNPDVIILTTSHREDFLNRYALENTSACKNQRIYCMNPDYLVRPSPRIHQGCAILHKYLYPGISGVNIR